LEKLNEAYAAKIFREAVKLTWINYRAKDLSLINDEEA
jgi:hypothetical protein